jgi:uncharacterized protein (DUF58 family)
MAKARTIDDPGEVLGPAREIDGLLLADAMPRLMVAARRTAATVLHGLHGRRRGGPGENFWQYRRFSSGEPARRVDWRRSARDQHLYVREREWEVSHTVWLWIDRSRSMWYRSSLAEAAKIERAIVLGLALGDILVDGGERVGLLGLTRPVANRNIISVFADTLRLKPEDPGLAPTDHLGARSEVVLVGDFLGPIEETLAHLNVLAARASRGHLVMIADPIEEVFPFSGRTEFRDPESGLKFIAGRAQDYRAAYAERLAAHRDAIASRSKALGWTFVIHRTDRPASEPLLALHARIGAASAGTGLGAA